MLIVHLLYQVGLIYMCTACADSCSSKPTLPSKSRKRFVERRQFLREHVKEKKVCGRCEIGNTSHMYVCAVCVSLFAGEVVQRVSLSVCGQPFCFRRTHAQLTSCNCTGPKSRDLVK